MGKDKWETQAQGKRAGSKGQRPSSTPKGITSYKFSSLEVEEVGKAGFGIADALKVLELLMVTRTLKFTLGVPVDRPGCYCVIRDGTAEWGEGLAISCWGKTPESCLVTAGWYLSRVNPDYPAFSEGQLGEQLLF